MPLCRLSLDGCLLHRGAKRLSSSPQQDQISFPPNRLSEQHGQHLQCAININEEPIRFPLERTLPIPAQTFGEDPGPVQTIQRQSFPASSQFGRAHCLRAFSKQWQHYLQDSYKTGLGQRIIKLFPPPLFSPAPSPVPRAPLGQPSLAATFPGRHLYSPSSTPPPTDKRPRSQDPKGGKVASRHLENETKVWALASHTLTRSWWGREALRGRRGNSHAAEESWELVREKVQALGSLRAPGAPGLAAVWARTEGMWAKHNKSHCLTLD